MKYVITVILVSLIALVGCSKEIQTNIKPFHAMPEACGELATSMGIIPPSKLATTYETKIIIRGDSYSVEKHLTKHGKDVAIRTLLEKGDEVVIVLTNEPISGDYFMQ